MGKSNFEVVIVSIFDVVIIEKRHTDLYIFEGSVKDLTGGV